MAGPTFGAAVFASAVPPCRLSRVGTVFLRIPARQPPADMVPKVTILREPTVWAAIVSGSICFACAAVSPRVWPLLMLSAIAAATAVGQARHRDAEAWRTAPSDEALHDRDELPARY